MTDKEIFEKWREETFGSLKPKHRRFPAFYMGWEAISFAIFYHGEKDKEREEMTESTAKAKWRIPLSDKND